MAFDMCVCLFLLFIIILFLTQVMFSLYTGSVMIALYDLAMGAIKPAHKTIYIHLHPCIHTSFRPSIHPASQPGTGPPVRPSIHPSNHPPVLPPVRLSVCPSVHLSIHPTTQPTNQPPSVSYLIIGCLSFICPSLPKPPGRISPNFTGIILKWPPFKVYQKISIPCIILVAKAAKRNNFKRLLDIFLTNLVQMVLG